MEFSTGEMTAGLKHPYSMNVSLKGQAEKLRIVCLQEISILETADKAVAREKME